MAWRRSLAVLVIVASIGRVGTPAAGAQEAPPPRYDPAGPDRNCSDFDTWEDAQAFYLAAGGPDRNPHRLDADRDGTACEALRDGTQPRRHGR